MCGICGIVTPASVPIKANTESMLRAMRHRGPDASGTWSGQGVCLGNCRLAIIGLGEAGNQPMSNEDGSMWIVYNGEIYNFIQLREELVRRGHRFSSLTDTEVVIHLYEEYGADCLSHLQGMFAFAIWDDKKKQLFLARDRLGIKPLYFTLSGGRFAFASEVRAFLRAGLVARKLDPEGVIGFFSLGSVPQPHTIISGVKALSPGHWLELKNGNLKVQRYWQPAFTPKQRLSWEEASSRVRTALEGSIRSHLVSEVPLGAFLSGGIDSSIVVALMRKFATGRLETFNITFPEVSFSEAEFARLVACRFETEHTEYEISCDQLKAELPNIIRAMDQPTVDGVNTYFVSKITREAGIVVALSGLGGDELFCGYPTFRDVPRLYRGLTPLRLAPSRIRGPLYRLLSSDGGSILRPKLASLLPGKLSLEETYAAYRALFVDGSLLRLLRPDFWDSQDVSFVMNHVRQCHRVETSLDLTDRVALLEMGVYMGNQLLRDTDAMSMAHSLEVRVPYLDNGFVDLVTHLPARLRTRGDMPKALLLQAVSDLLPGEMFRRKKQGFTFPFAPWLKQGLKPLVSEVLSPTSVEKNGVLQPSTVDFMWKRFLEGKDGVDWSRVWLPFVFQLWCQEMMIEL